MDLNSPTSLDHEGAAAWLRSPYPMEEEPFGAGVDRSLEFPGALDGGIPGHIRFYLHEPIPNPEKRRFLLNAIYVLAWKELAYMFPKQPGWRWAPGPLPHDAEYVIDHLEAALELTDRVNNAELGRWANSVRLVLERKKHPRFGYWCGWGWLWQGPLTSIWWP